MKYCHWCRAQLQDHVQQCPYCTAVQAAPAIQQQVPKNKKSYWWAYVLSGLFVLGVIGTAIDGGGKTAKKSATDKKVEDQNKDKLSYWMDQCPNPVKIIDAKLEDVGVVRTLLYAKSKAPWLMVQFKIHDPKNPSSSWRYLRAYDVYPEEGERKGKKYLPRLVKAGKKRVFKFLDQQCPKK